VNLGADNKQDLTEPAGCAFFFDSRSPLIEFAPSEHGHEGSPAFAVRRVSAIDPETSARETHQRWLEWDFKIRA